MWIQTWVSQILVSHCNPYVAWELTCLSNIKNGSERLIIKVYTGIFFISLYIAAGLQFYLVDEEVNLFLVEESDD